MLDHMSRLQVVISDHEALGPGNNSVQIGVPIVDGSEESAGVTPTGMGHVVQRRAFRVGYGLQPMAKMPHLRVA